MANGREIASTSPANEYNGTELLRGRYPAIPLAISYLQMEQVQGISITLHGRSPHPTFFLKLPSNDSSVSKTHAPGIVVLVCAESVCVRPAGTVHVDSLHGQCVFGAVA